MGTQFGVDLVFKAVGGDKIGRELKKVSVAARKVSGDVGQKIKKSFDQAGAAAQGFGRKVERAFKRAAIKAERFKRSLSGIKGLFAQLAVAATGIGALKIGIGRQQSEAQLTAIARSYGEIDQALAAAQRTAETFNLSQTEANKEFSALYARLRPLGAEIGAIENAYAGLQTVIKTLQLDGNQAAAVFTQVSQALGAGRVELEEFGTVIDNAPTIVAALAKELDVLPNEIKTLVGQGKVSSEQLYRAILRVKEEGVDVLAESFNAPQERIKAFQNTVEDVVVALTTDVIPVLLDALDDIGVALDALVPVAQVTGRAIALAFELALIPVQGFAKLVSDIASGNWGEVFKFDAGGFSKISDAFGKAFRPLEKFERPDRKGGDGFNITRPDDKDKGGGSSKASSAAAARAAEQAAKQLQSSQDLLDVLEQQLKIQQAKEGFDKIQAEYDLEVLQLNQQYRDSLADSVTEQERLNLAKAQGLELDILLDQKRKDQFAFAQKEFEAFVNNEKDLNTELTQTQELLKGAYDIVAQELTGAIQGLIKGTTEWGDVLSSILSQLGSMFLQAGFNGLGSALKIPGYADGGRPAVSKPAIVGERGPELFVPDSAGTVVSNDDIFAATRSALSGGGSGGADGDSGGLYGASASSPYASTSQGQAAAFAAAASAMNTTRETRESTKMMEFAEAEKLALANPAPIDIKYDSRVINSETYVTEAQFQKGLSQSAKQARAMTINDLRNKPASRKRAGGLADVSRHRDLRRDVIDAAVSELLCQVDPDLRR